VHRDEIVSLLRDLDREEQAGARGFYLTGANGNSAYTVDRIGRGFDLYIPAVCLSLIGSTQPGRIAAYVHAATHGGRGDDGLIQRFGMMIWPDISGEWRNVDRWPDSEAKRNAFSVYKRLDELDIATLAADQDMCVDGGHEGLPYLRFDTNALGQFVDWRTELERRLRTDDCAPALISHLNKYRKLVPSLAMLFHLADGYTGPVGEQALLRALAWAEYLETHARRVYGSGPTSEAATARAIVSRIRKGDLPLEFSSRDVWRPGWSGLSDRVGVGNALVLLTELDYLAVDRVDTSGRTATRYTVNPRVLQ
jgi:putative DNA primase/helicase